MNVFFGLFTGIKMHTLINYIFIEIPQILRCNESRILHQFHVMANVFENSSHVSEKKLTKVAQGANILYILRNCYY